MGVAARVLRRPVLTLLGAVVCVAILMTLGALLVAPLVSDPVGHGLSHAFVAAPFAVVVVAAARMWPPPRPTVPGPLGRRVAVAGLSGVVLGQVLEAIGWRVDEPTATAVEGVMHTAGQIVTTLALLVAVGGAVLSLVAAARDRAVPKWIAALIVLGMSGMLVFMIFGSPDPNA